MADASITAANVVPDDDADLEAGTAGEDITAGQAVYIDLQDDRKMKRADADAAASAKARGIAANTASNGQPISIIRDGALTVGGSALTAGEVYAVSKTAGGIAPIGDLTTGDYITTLGIASDANTLAVQIQQGPARG